MSTKPSTRFTPLKAIGLFMVLVVILAALHRPLFPWLDRLSHTPVAQVRGRHVLIAISLSAAIVIIPLAFFQVPTDVVVNWGS